MTMDKLFDGSDAHLLLGNAELISDLRERINPAYADQRGTESYERKQCADALEAADKRIAEERETYDRLFEEGADKLFAAESEYKAMANLAAAYLRDKQEAERKLDVAQEALKNLFLSSPIALECNDMHHAKKDQHEYDEDCPVLSRYEDALSGAREALAQIGGDDAG
jgi:hypothetical protein